MTAPNIRHPPPVRHLVWESPLVPVAWSVTFGLLLDRYGLVSLQGLWLGLALSIVLAVVCFSRYPAATLPMLWVCSGWTAALYHHAHRHAYPADDIGWLADAEPRLVRLRGWLVEQPTRFPPRPRDSLVPFTRLVPTRCVLRVREMELDGHWQARSGKVYLTADGPLTDLHLGDEVEVFGWLRAPLGPMNPGGFDRRSHLSDQRIRAVVHVRQTSATIVRLEQGWHRDFWGVLAWLRGWGRRTFETHLPEPMAGLATALILGDSSAMTPGDWEKYVLTGVIHVLAISGQHLVILGAIIGWGLRRLGCRRRLAILVTASLLTSYAFVTGFRPPVQRAAIAAVVTCLAILARRVPLPANTFALAWLMVIAWNPTDIFQLGCQLSFLQVAVLLWGVSRWRNDATPDPLDQLLEEAKPRWQRVIRKAAVSVGSAYAVTLVLTGAAIPLVVSRQNVISLSGLLLGPPLIVLSTVALGSGFVLLLLAPLGGARYAAEVMRQALTMGETLVDWGVSQSWGHVYVPAPPTWWLWGFYLGLLLWLWGRPRWSQPMGWILALAAWLTALVTLPWAERSNELRVTFLAVGHGGCTVIETPDGRVLLYDAGSMTGPEVTRQHIAPFLWSRGYLRIDELFLSHADIDHFNGTIELLNRFRVGRVSYPPSFQDKSTPAVRQTLAAIDQCRIPRQEVRAGHTFDAAGVRLMVLHPPEKGPIGPENHRSLVLRLEHHGHVVLLTGDLESAASEPAFFRTPGGVDVLMAPHHGSRFANTPRLAQWAKPRLVVVCTGAHRSEQLAEVYDDTPVWTTADDGAILIRSHASGLVGESYRTGRRWVVPLGQGRSDPTSGWKR